jgi:uncharacterized membrane protein YjfL (UPF0719 family)
MRIAALILGLVFSFILFLQSFAVFGLSSAIEQEDSAGAGAVGVLAAVLWLVAAAMAIGFPLASTIIFSLTSIILFGVSGSFPDLAVWGGVALFLAFLSFLGWRGKKKEVREKTAERIRQEERDLRLEQFMAQQAGPRTRPNHLSCPSCGSTNGEGTKFCGECGHPLALVHA